MTFGYIEYAVPGEGSNKSKWLRTGVEEHDGIFIRPRFCISLPHF